MSCVVNWTLAGVGIAPMIGPSTKPRNRSMIVHAAPPARAGTSAATVVDRNRDDHSGRRDRHEEQSHAWNDLEVWDRDPAGSVAATGSATANESSPLRCAILNTVYLLGKNAEEGRPTRTEGAEGAGFEPAVRGCRTPVFKTGAFDRSATPPGACGHDRSRVHRHPTRDNPALHCPRPQGEVAEWLKALAC